MKVFYLIPPLRAKGQSMAKPAFGSSDSDEKRINETLLNSPGLLMAGAACYPDLPSGAENSPQQCKTDYIRALRK